LELNRNVNVLGLREGTMLWSEDSSLKLIGVRTLRLFRYGSAPVELSETDDLSFLLNDC